jgi:magnesium chelatase accessory protein
MTAALALSEPRDAAQHGLPDADWPLRAHSRLVACDGLRWHVQILGHGPPALLLHGTGASTHSWRDVAPLLAEHHTVIALDLPGQGFTRILSHRSLSLPGMAQAIGALLRRLHLAPELVIGHSAGAAIGLQLCLDHIVTPRGLVSINGAILPLGGWAGRTFSPLARLLVGLPGVPTLFAGLAAQRSTVERLLRDTGSQLDAQGTALYARLLRRPEHVGAALGMMAAWDLDALAARLPRLPRLRVPLLLLVGERDRTIPPADARRVRRLVPSARIASLPGLGHLAHEEDPRGVVARIHEMAET